ncbi:hypothetical protein FNU79_10590 [Deinococcus detaillensis]|uniref:Uncharacterized protein n=1 Tax=Deinococcus detaillensis TaxID=2592048 RepID=A0A553UWU1_9DEIO|nr:hypothetical protein [Deinococcus detaillensis]TSA84672.1 hypothetical protein FNU79_10590 [Deinococcus detaillensis]
MAKPKAPRVPDVAVAFRELPGTSVGFWVVSACPFCGAQHFHAAGAGKSDPFEKLGEVEARCGQGRYVIGLPPKPKRKKERRAENKRARKAQGGALDDIILDDWDE